MFIPAPTYWQLAFACLRYQESNPMEFDVQSRMFAQLGMHSLRTALNDTYPKPPRKR